MAKTNPENRAQPEPPSSVNSVGRNMLRAMCFSAFLFVSILAFSTTAPAHRTTLQLTDNTNDDTQARIADSGHVTYVRQGDVFTHDGTTERQITGDDGIDYYPDINRYGSVSYYAYNIVPTEGDVFLYYDGEPHLLVGSQASSFGDDSKPKINCDGWLTWKIEGCGWTDDSPARVHCVYNIYRYNGTSEYFINSSHYYAAYDVNRPKLLPHPDINSKGEVVYIDNPYFERYVYLTNGYETVQVPHSFETDLKGGPKINDKSHIVWSGRGPGLPDTNNVFLYDGATTHQITDSGSNDYRHWSPQINNRSHLVWARKDRVIDTKFNIFYYDGISIHQLTYNDDPNTSTDPKINDTGLIVWQSFDGNDYEIILKDGNDIIQLTDNTTDDISPEINNRGEIIWQHFDGNDYEIFLSKPSAEPETHWAKTFGGVNDDAGSCVRQTKDKGYVIVGGASSFGSGRMWVIKLDNNGNSEWQRTYGDGHYGASVIEQTSDEGYILAGSTSAHDPDGDMWLMRLNADGTIAWQKSYGGPEPDVATSVQQAGDGGYIVAGHTESFGAGEKADVWLIKVDAAGNVGDGYPGTWQKTYGTASGGEWGAFVRQTGGGGYIVAAASYSFGAGGLDFWVMKLSPTGVPEWQKTYGGADMDIPSSIQKTGDTGYIVAGKSFSFDPGGTSWDAWVIKLTAAGEIGWQRVYDLGRDEGATAVVKSTGDGSYVVTGHTSASAPGLSEGWIMKLDGGGNILWRKMYGGPEILGMDHLASIDQTTDGGFVAVGYTDAFGFGDRNLWVLKLGANGQIDDCPAVKTGSTLSGTTSCTITDTAATGTPTAITASVTAATANSTEAHEGDGCRIMIISGLVHLPKTGQTVSYHPGDDGDLRAGLTWPSPRFRDNGDGTVTDRLTGLIWLKDANCAQTVGHDPDGAGSGLMQWTSALDFVAAINAGAYPLCSGGHTDWRLPNINELASLTHLGEPNQASWLHGQGFQDIQTEYGSYWSSTTTVNWDGGARTITMSDGHYNWAWKTANGYVWPARAGQQDLPDPTFPANVWKTGQTISYYDGDDGDLRRGISWPSPRFTDNGDGTVTDNLTSLMWLKDANCYGTPDFETAYDTIADFNVHPGGYACADYTASYDDWRVPNRGELLSLIDHSRQYPPLPTGYPFVDINPGQYRSCTTHANVDYMEWQVDLYYYGGVSYSGRGGKPLWPVRGGKHGTLCSADLDTDGDVDGMDLALFLSDFVNPACGSGETCPGDLDDDGDVDLSDLATIALELGTGDCIH